MLMEGTDERHVGQRGNTTTPWHYPFRGPSRTRSMEEMRHVNVAQESTGLPLGDMISLFPEAVKAEHADATLAVALLFAIVIVPPVLRVRLMYTACWLVFAVASHAIESSAALGIATSMGITVMTGWYTLRAMDRTAFTAVLNGWLGRWADSKLLGVFARIGDLVIHLVFPVSLLYLYLPHVRVWMCIPALISSRLWTHFVVGGGHFPKADHVYKFVPPRSQHFWNTAYRMELVLNVLVPCCCELAHYTGMYHYVIDGVQW